MTVFVILLIAIICVQFFFIHKRVEIDNQTRKLNLELINEKNELQINIKKLKNEYILLKADQQEIEQIVKNLYNENAALKEEKTGLMESISALQVSSKILKEQAEESAAAAFDAAYTQMYTKLDLASEKLGADFRKQEEEYQDEYLLLLEENASIFKEQIDALKAEYQETSEQLEDLKKKTSMAIEAAKREEEKKTKEYFYCLQLSDIDKTEIQRLIDITPYFRNSEPIAKIIWKVYYESAFNDLTGRIIKPSSTIGIYKITNIENQMCYIGQSVDLKERLKTHIKAGLGIGGSNNALYTSMRKNRVENFTYEILEYCERSALNEREKFWIDYYQANVYGLNSTGGGARI